MEHPLTARRLELGLTREQMGEAMGVEAMTIYRWERGTSLPRRKYWPRLSELTGLEIADIVGGVGCP